MMYADEQRQFQEYAERVSLDFRRRYGLAEEDAWSDEQLERALADHGYPSLAELPGEPTGMIAGLGQAGDNPHHWRRANAAHLLAHAMLHGGARCGGCAGWGRS